jgi:hypothetical protein
LLILGSSFNSFETLDIDDNEPINLIAGEINDLMEEVQLDYPNFIYDIQKEGSELTRLENLFGETYEFSVQQESERNIAWSIAYIDLLPKIEDVISTAETEGYTNHLGVAKVLKAFTLLTLVDFYGDVPYSEIAGPNSNGDDGAIIYAEALTRLEDAIDRFNEGTDQMEVDYYYNNDFQKWTKLANTLRMNVYLNTRLVDADAFVNFNAIASVGNFISNSDDDFEFKYGNANMQHPEYLNNYSSMGVGYSYRSNWLMDKMLSQDDPRIRYYFYRQVACTPVSIGVNGDTCMTIWDEAALSCSVMPAPDHYPVEMTFCTLNDGYWGRDHGNFAGIPPDSFKRSASGVYPSAGKFDDDEFVLVSVGAGGAGAGIIPLMLASWVDFMNSEMALVDGNEGAAQDYLFLGMQKSIEKVMGFISVDSGADATYAPASVDVSNYLTSVVSIFSNGDINAKWNVLAEQQFISHYGNGINSYNTYRRTGFPTFLQYHLTADPGPFVRSLLYPTDEVNDNSNISQKPGVDIQVFWDSNPAHPAFPLAN